MTELQNVIFNALQDDDAGTIGECARLAEVVAARIESKGHWMPRGATITTIGEPTMPSTGLRKTIESALRRYLALGGSSRLFYENLAAYLEGTLEAADLLAPSEVWLVENHWEIKCATNSQSLAQEIAGCVVGDTVTKVPLATSYDDYMLESSLSKLDSFQREAVENAIKKAGERND